MATAGPWQVSQIESLQQAKLTQKNILVGVWWTSAGVVSSQLSQIWPTIKPNVYCQNLQTMIEKLAAKQPSLSLYATLASRQR